MELKNYDEKSVVLELTAEEFHDLVDAVFIADEEFENLDHVAFNVPLERLVKLRDALSDISKARAQHFRRVQESIAK